MQFAGLCVSVCQCLVPVYTSLWRVFLCVLGVVGRPSVPRGGLCVCDTIWCVCGRLWTWVLYVCVCVCVDEECGLCVDMCFVCLQIQTHDSDSCLGGLFELLILPKKPRGRGEYPLSG